MFVVRKGRVRVTIEPSGQEVAIIPAGGFFGEMSLLTGDPRTATVRAAEDSVVLEIAAPAFGPLAAANPQVLEHITTVIGSRQVGLDEARASAAATVPQAGPRTLLERMKKFLSA